jgi:hypothetical protein
MGEVQKFQKFRNFIIFSGVASYISWFKLASAGTKQQGCKVCTSIPQGAAMNTATRLQKEHSKH